MGIGSASVSYSHIIPTILGHGSFKDEFVLFDIRLPRMLIALLSGMALALSGSILQAVTWNDLAIPAS
ncbi:ferrichrome ABC transporter permease [Paenibacillus sabinae T27]|uniref:Ferrichrome ABC transporter permease n=1 Tax=Paenibacillus sabinae T27 TaxID=1268072 RepID=X4ZYJ2_9BACL|nr:ferrichrome ABC transporter permease [Paenibacillus sabinae T27]